MSNVSGVALIICGCAVICSIVELILPSAKMQSSAKIVIAVFFLFCVISPIRNFVTQLSYTIDSVNDNNIPTISNSIDYNKLLLDETIKKSTQALKILLNEEDITITDANIDAHISENYCIKIDSISIYIDVASNDELLKINSLVYKNFGILPNIVVGN